MKIGAVYAYGNILALVLYLSGTLLLSLVQVKDAETEKFPHQEPMSAIAQDHDPGPQQSVGLPHQLPKPCPNPSSKPISVPSSLDPSLPPLPPIRSAELDNLVFTPPESNH